MARMSTRRSFWSKEGLVLLLLTASTPAVAPGAPNFLIVAYDPIWVPPLEDLADLRENLDFDHEGARPWEVEVKSLAWIRANYPGAADTAKVKAYIADRHAVCTGDLFVLLVGDANDPHEPEQTELDHLGMRYLFACTVGWWSDWVSTDDLYADVGGGGELEACAFRLPAHSLAEVETYVAKAANVFFNQSWLARPHSPGRRRLDDPPAGIQRHPRLHELFLRWAEGADAAAAAGPSGGGQRTSHYLAYGHILAYDTDNGGRSGALVREHGAALRELWASSAFDVGYTGDVAPGNYWAREAAADSLENDGLQFSFSLGTTSNRSDRIHFQDLRPP